MAKKKAWGGARKGAGRPANPEGKAVTIVASVPESLAAGLDERAQAEGWSRSKAVAEAIRALLKRKKGA
jgi:metal-responsive CopG/Arc/MetJ family transcriptional regulator